MARIHAVQARTRKVLDLTHAISCAYRALRAKQQVTIPAHEIVEHWTDDDWQRAVELAARMRQRPMGFPSAATKAAVIDALQRQARLEALTTDPFAGLV